MIRVVSCVSVVGVLLGPVHAEQPTRTEALAAGRTIYVADTTTDQISAQPVLAALQNWKRFNIVPQRDRADLVLTVGFKDPGAALDLPTSSIDRRPPPRVFLMEVTDRATGTQLWAGNRDAGLRSKRTLQKLVEQFRQSVERSQTSR